MAQQTSSLPSAIYNMLIFDTKLIGDLRIAIKFHRRLSAVNN
ncbi:hypothetical protein NSP_26120 [Nodularia spumigena CCY9414]|nr:hypothetical protein NSP_26120 [Nodularia spumigena CCY9414]